MKEWIDPQVQQEFINYVRSLGGDAKPLTVDIRGCVIFNITAPPNVDPNCWGQEQVNRFDSGKLLKAPEQA
jgi:hypothetical protein